MTLSGNIVGDSFTGAALRVALVRELTGPQAVQKFFVGRPEILGEMLHEKAMAATQGYAIGAGQAAQSGASPI